MDVRVRSAQERRAEIQAKAAQLGIDEAYIGLLVDTFYARVRADARLGPIFEKAIGDNWGPHLATMKNFWTSVALNAGRYSGRPVPKHKALTQVRAEDFAIWLSLFRQTLMDTAPTPGSIPYFMERAERIARSLQLAMFYSPLDDAPME